MAAGYAKMAWRGVGRRHGSMEAYRLEDFPMEQGTDALIQKGVYGYKVEIPIMNPCVPEVFRDMVLRVLNRFMDMSDKENVMDDIDLVAGSVEAYLTKGLAPGRKYIISLFLWVREGSGFKDYVWKYQVRPGGKDFQSFRDCVMAGLKDMVFGNF